MANDRDLSQQPRILAPISLGNAPARTILMTGGTGFLGLHILRSYLLQGHSVRLLAHAGQISALARIRRFLTHCGDSDALSSELESHLTVFDVDIAKTDLGVTETNRGAITENVDEMWHIAATIMLDGRDDHVWHTNVVGTENVLRLYAQTPPHALYRHVSTAFVAGSDRQTSVFEDSTDAVRDFENTYERSKHAAEAIVRQWAAEEKRSVLILRPSILVPSMAVTCETPQGGLPEHTLRTVGQIVTRIVERYGQSGSRLVLRLGADPRAHLNFVQVDWAAETMLQLAERLTSGVETVHVVHDSDTPIRFVSAALQEIIMVRMRMMPALPAEPTAHERLFYRRFHGFLPYWYHRRSFEAAKLKRSLPELVFPERIDTQHLAGWMADNQSTLASQTPDAHSLDAHSLDSHSLDMLSLQRNF